MKKLTTALTSIFIFFLLLNAYAQPATVNDMAKNDSYKAAASASASFAIGKPAYATMILDLWKDWDDNDFDRHDYMADTVVMIFSDGTSVRGKAANLAAAKKYRGTMAKVKSTIHAVVPLTRTTANEDVVCIWGQEENTLADGKVETKDLHEVWWFNKAGKVIMLRQWTANFKE